MEDREPRSDAMDGMPADGNHATALMSEEEKRVLELHDRSVQLEYEIALLRAYKERSERKLILSRARGYALGLQGNLGMQIDNQAQLDVSSAYARAMKSGAAYQLRKDAVESVLTVKPILSAVHDRKDASYIER
jgi:hypothetical protein